MSEFNVYLPPVGEPMDADTADILGRLCFRCVDIAGVLRLGGHLVPRKAEGEQAYCLAYLLDMRAKHGAEWRTAADEDLRSIVAAAKAKGATP